MRTHQFHGDSELIPSGSPLRVIAISASTAGITPGNADAVKVYLPLPSNRIEQFPLTFAPVRIRGAFLGK